jgi:hypothetical protein
VINQPNATGQNKAVVWMVTPKLTGLTQSSNYSASITQGPASATGSSNNNLACVRQFVWIDGSTTKTNAASTTVTNDNHESISINQNSLTGTNTVEGAKLSGGTYDCDTTQPLQQDEQLTSVVTSKGSITQNQDTATPGFANVVVDIEQNQNVVGGFKGNALGLNNAAFEQSTNQVAIANTTTGATVNQTQGANVPNPPFSGLVGTINQDSSSPSIASATQTETQCEDAVNTALSPAQLTCDTNDPDAPAGITLTQTQYGPEGVFTPPTPSQGRVPYNHKGYGASTQTGNSGGGSGFTLHQFSTQNTDAGPNTTQSNIIQGDCITDGSCEAGQKATLNGQNTLDGYTAGTITALIINCPNGHSSCMATPPPAPVITGHPDAQTTSTDATFTWTEAATAGVTFTCSLDSVPGPCDSSTSTSYTGLSHGPHTFEVTVTDAGGNTSSDSFSWEIIPYLTFEVSDPDFGATAGWSGTPGSSPITLTTGSDDGTYAQFTIHDRNDLTVSDLALEEPTFTTDFYVGAPRYEIDLDNGDYLFGYPPEAGFGSNSWDVNCGHPGCTPMAFVSWADVQNAEGSATVTDVLIEADFPANFTYSISDFQFDGYHPSDVAP